MKEEEGKKKGGVGEGTDDSFPVLFIMLLCNLLWALTEKLK